MDLDLLAAGQRHLEADRGHRHQELEVVLALEPLAHDVHVQEPEEPGTEAEAERVRALGLPRQRGVVERQLLERLAKLGEALGVDREEAAEDHRLDVAVAGQRLRRGARPRRHGVANAQLRDVLDAGDQVSDVAGAKLLDRPHRRREEADLVDLGADEPTIVRIASPLRKTPSTTRT